MFGNKRKQLENWLNLPVKIESCNDSCEGVIKYGVRLPIKPADTPIQECEAGSKEKIEGQKPSYWFVNEERVLKVKLLTHKIDDERNIITGIGRDTGIFKYKIMKLN